MLPQTFAILFASIVVFLANSLAAPKFAIAHVQALSQYSGLYGLPKG